MFYFVYVSSVGLSQFGYVLFSWFQLVCFVLFRFVWPSICFTSIFCLLPIHLSCIFLFSFELQLMCHGWHGCGGTWFVLIWFRFCEVVPELVLYPVMSHLVSLSFAEWAFSTTTDRMHYTTIQYNTIDFLLVKNLYKDKKKLFIKTIAITHIN